MTISRKHSIRVLHVNNKETANELNNFISTSRNAVILFYSNSCGFCKMMKPDWDRAVNDVSKHEKSKAPFLIANVDVSSPCMNHLHPSITANFTGAVPTIFTFVNTKPEVFDKDRTYHNFHSWLLSQLSHYGAKHGGSSYSDPINLQISFNSQQKKKTRRNQRTKHNTRRKKHHRKNKSLFDLP